jgi:hypothetical protein
LGSITENNVKGEVIGAKLIWLFSGMPCWNQLANAENNEGEGA